MIYCLSHTLLGKFFLRSFHNNPDTVDHVVYGQIRKPSVKTRHNKNSDTGESNNSTLTFDPGCEHCLGIRSTVDLCRFCVLSLHKGGGRCLTIHTVKIAVHSAKRCCTATTMGLTYTEQWNQTTALIRMMKYRC